MLLFNSHPDEGWKEDPSLYHMFSRKEEPLLCTADPRSTHSPSLTTTAGNNMVHLNCTIGIALNGKMIQKVILKEVSFMLVLKKECDPVT